MGTSHTNHNDEADKNVGRLLKEGNNGSLARAKETLKDRLYQQMIREVRDEFEDAEEVASHALSQEADWGSSLEAARAALKKQLVAQMIEQALDEARQELEDTERVIAEVMQDPAVDPDALVRIKQAFKERLMADMLEEAIAEIQDEMGTSEDSDAESSWDSVDEDEDEDTDSFEPESFADIWEEDESEEADLAALAEEMTLLEDDDSTPLIDMHFWNEEEVDQAEEPTVIEPIDSVTEASGEPAADPDFFPQDVVAEPGESFGDGSSAEPIADGTPISFLAGFSMSEAALDEAGDGASHELDEADTSEHLSESEEKAEEWGAYYVYGVFSAEHEVDESLLPSSGIDPEFPLFVHRHGDIAAIISAVDRDAFGEAALAKNLKDEQWREAAMLMHEGLVEDCRAIPGFLPMSFGSVYSSLERVQHLLELVHNMDAIARNTGRNEWTVRVYRDRETLHQRIMERSETVQGIMAEIKSKPKGEARGINKRMVATIQEEIAETTDHCTSEVHEQLLTYADDARLGTPDRRPGDKGEGIFDATYLVHGDQEFDFHTDLEALSRDYEDLGFQIEVQGPVLPVLRLPSSLSASL